MYVMIANGLIHRDLKPKNILRKGKYFKITDFGQTDTIKKMQKVHSSGGTSYYKSPEAYFERQYTEKCDVWALGIILYQVGPSLCRFSTFIYRTKSVRTPTVGA